MDRNPVDAASAAAQLIGLRRVGHLPQSGLGAGLRDAACRGHGGARGGVHLGGVMHLDDFSGLEVRGSHGCELHGQDRTHRKVRGDQDGASRGLRMLTHARVGLIRPAGRAHDDIHARVEEGVHVGLGDARDREVDGHLRAVHALGRDLISRVEECNDLHIRGARHRLDNSRAHTALGSGHCHANHCALLHTVMWLSSEYSRVSEASRGWTGGFSLPSSHWTGRTRARQSSLVTREAASARTSQASTASNSARDSSIGR